MKRQMTFLILLIFVFFISYSLFAQNETKINACDGASEDQFGFSVSIHGDYVAVGAAEDDDNGDLSGSVYIFNIFDCYPYLLSINDVANDQGGRVIVKWHASDLDNNISTLPYYSIWRALPEEALLKGSKVFTKVISKDFSGSAYRLASLNGEGYTWEWLTNQPAHCLNEYTYTAPT